MSALDRLIHTRRDHAAYETIANRIHPLHEDCHHMERVNAENTAALAWRLHHPWRLRLSRLQHFEWRERLDAAVDAFQGRR